MPDMREVYEMVTEQKPAPPGALERQRTRQVRVTRNRKAGAFAVAATLVAVLVAVGFESLRDPPANERTGGALGASGQPVFDLAGVGGGFSADGRWLFIEEPNAPSGRIFDAATGEPVRSVSGPAGDLLLDFSPDGSHFMTVHGGAGSDRYTEIYASRTGERVHRFHGLCCVGVFAPDGRSVALPAADGTRVYTIAGARVTRAEAPVGLWSFSPDGARLMIAPCCGSEEEGVSAYIGSVNEPGWGDYLTLEGAPVDHIAWSGGGTAVAATDGDRVRIWDATTGEESRSIEAPVGTTFTSVVFVGDGGIVTGTSDGDALVWHLTARGVERSLVHFDHGSTAIDVFADPAGRRVMTSDGTTAKVWDLPPM
jgi:WD40 repeat protein